MFITNSKLFTGKKPPDEINVKEKLKESKALKSLKYKIIKIIPAVSKILFYSIRNFINIH